MKKNNLEKFAAFINLIAQRVFHHLSINLRKKEYASFHSLINSYYTMKKKSDKLFSSFS